MLLLAMALAIAAPPTAERARELLGRPVPDAVAAFQLWDAGFRNGQGNSTDPTSGGLGWGEASFLRNYLSCWYVTGDSYWLDKVVDHFDRMLASQHDRNQDGFLAWDDRAYSVGIVTVKSSEKAAGLTLEPATQRLNATSGGTKITGHRYAVIFAAAEQVRVVDLTADKVVLPETAYAGELVLDLFGGKSWRTLAEAKAAGAITPLTLKGTGRPGARFVIESLAPESIEYVVHDGMVTYPIAQFIEAVLSGAAPAAYRAKAQQYLAWFEQHIYLKWEKYWRQVDEQTGAYTFTSAGTERYPGYLLPHNQYLALARAYLVLGALPEVPRRADYQAKAEAMARYFQRHLTAQLEGRAWLWNYWDPPAGQTVRRNPEDASHATIDVGFVVEAARRKVVFSAEDAVKIARTYTDVMSNGDPQAPRLSHRVDGKGEKKDTNTWDWILLGEFDEAALRQAAQIAQSGPTSAPQLCEVVWRLGGVSEADRRTAQEHTARLAALLPELAAGNLSFEHGLADRPGGWSWATWSTTGTGRFEWSTDACDGQRSVALIGESGTPNLVAELANLKLPKPGVYTVTLKYKTQGEARPHLSFIAQPPNAEQQYDRSGQLPLSETWREATWSFTAPAGVSTGRFHVRNSGVGTVWYDAIAITPPP